MPTVQGMIISFVLGIITMAVILTLAGCSESPRCLKYHTELRTAPESVSFVWFGSSMIPIVHPEYQYTIRVCDEFEKVEKIK